VPPFEDFDPGTDPIVEQLGYVESMLQDLVNRIVPLHLLVNQTVTGVTAEIPSRGRDGSLLLLSNSIEWRLQSINGSIWTLQNSLSQFAQQMRDVESSVEKHLL